MIPFVDGYLPIFRLKAASSLVDQGKVDALRKEFGLLKQAVTTIGNVVRYEDGARYLEVSPGGQYWFADDDFLWNPNVKTPTLPAKAVAQVAACDLIDRLGMRPKSTSEVKVISGVGAFGSTTTMLAPLSSSGQAERTSCVALDAYIGICVAVAVTDPRTGELVEARAEGKNTKLGVVFGDKGTIIGFNASWRDIVDVQAQVPAQLPTAPVFKSGRARAAAVVDQGGARLIYRYTELKSDGPDIPCLCPYWLFRVSGIKGDRDFPTCDIASPAADFTSRVKSAPITSYSVRTASSEPNKVTTNSSIGVSWKTNKNSGSTDEVNGVLTQATAALGWGTRFAWKDDDAWESDWSSNAAKWVDDVDLAYYAGHADFEGWQLTDAADATKHSWLQSALVGKTKDVGALIWSNKLKWIIIAACGPLQDQCIGASKRNVFAWAGAFDGLRMLLGFGTDIAGFTGEGARALELAGRGVPLAKAWLRAAREQQPFLAVQKTDYAPVARWAAVLAAETDTDSALDDVLPHGTGAKTGTMRPTKLRAIWTPA
jgi:hypothetical protein